MDVEEEKKKPLLRTWDDRFLFKAYDLAKTGMSDGEIAQYIGVGMDTFARWKKTQRPLLGLALEIARSRKPGEAQATFMEYVYKRLSPPLQKKWQEIHACENLENGLLRARAIVEDMGVEMRQHLFLYAYVDSGFNASEALRKLGLAKVTLDSWIQRDLRFRQLIDEMHWHKKNFFEGAFIDLIKKGDTAAIIHANKTINRDRGYNERHEVEVKVAGQIQHTHQIDVLSLQLPVEVKRLILKAMREEKARREEAAKAGGPVGAPLALPAPPKGD